MRKRTIPKTEENLRLELYHKGLYDKEIAIAVGSNQTSIFQWRKKRGLPTQYERRRAKRERMDLKPGPIPPGSYRPIDRVVPGQAATRRLRCLSPEQIKTLRRFASDLIGVVDLYSLSPDGTEIMRFAREWREIGGVKK